MVSLGYAYIMTHPGEGLKWLGTHPGQEFKGFGTDPSEGPKGLRARIGEELAVCRPGQQPPAALSSTGVVSGVISAWQQHWPFPAEMVSLGYAYIMTHPDEGLGNWGLIQGRGWLLVGLASRLLKHGSSSTAAAAQQQQQHSSTAAAARGGQTALSHRCLWPTTLPPPPRRPAANPRPALPIAPPHRQPPRPPLCRCDPHLLRFSPPPPPCFQPTAYPHIARLPAGVPCVFWEHFFDWGDTLRKTIINLIDVRKRNGIKAGSKLEILCAEADMYVARINER